MREMMGERNDERERDDVREMKRERGDV